ncbi:MAG: group II intron reverse transcriptase/maturase [Gammaproteobacteria bacterium]|nr:group II intron reverse transcriptase/maturase [Gammaproteobacteria bacterium]
MKSFEQDLKNNLYKIWNRMSSGSYFPPPVLRVEIPKGDGKMRLLGIPTVADRIAQMVVKNHLEPELEAVFHADSYGYRPKRSARQAVSLYVERWLKAPVQTRDGVIEERNMGTPQGGVISPLLANLFLHYAFDHWMQSNYPSNPFERYADDSVVHCESKLQAMELKSAIAGRMEQCGLELHPEKTKVVYCKDASRTEDYKLHSFDFLGFCFRPRLSRNKYGQYFVNFSPAIAPKAKKEIFAGVRQWCLHRRSDLSVTEIANKINPVVRGWIEYYGAFFQSELIFLVYHLDKVVYRWVIRKYKKHGGNFKRAERWLNRIKRKSPNYFVHWGLLRA